MYLENILHHIIINRRVSVLKNMKINEQDRELMIIFKCCMDQGLEINAENVLTNGGREACCSFMKYENLYDLKKIKAEELKRYRALESTISD